MLDEELAIKADLEAEEHWGEESTKRELREEKQTEVGMALQHGGLGEGAEGHTGARGHVIADGGVVQGCAAQIEAGRDGGLTQRRRKGTGG